MPRVVALSVCQSGVVGTCRVYAEEILRFIHTLVFASYSTANPNDEHRRRSVAICRSLVNVSYEQRRDGRLMILSEPPGCPSANLVRSCTLPMTRLQQSSAVRCFVMSGTVTFRATIRALREKRRILFMR